MKKSILAVAGVAAFAGVALPFGGVSALTTQQTDNISITIADNCALSYGTTDHTNGGTGNNDGKWSTSGNTLSATRLNNTATANLGKTTLKVVCNNTGGYDVKLTASDLTNSTTSENIAFSNSTPTAGTSSWGVSISTDGETDSWVSDGDEVKTSDDPTAGTEFTVTYGIGLSGTQEAGTYTGTAQYDLTAPAA